MGRICDDHFSRGGKTSSSWVLSKSTPHFTHSEILTAGFHLFAALENTVLEVQIEFVGVDIGEALVDHSCVRVKDAVEGKTGSLDWVLVHFCFINYKFIT